MKVEIVGFYPTPQGKSLGSMHVFIHDIAMPFDIRGILIRRRKNGILFFQMPGKTVWEQNESKEKFEKKFFPFFSFFDADLQKKMIGLIIKEGTKFLKKELKDKK